MLNEGRLWRSTAFFMCFPQASIHGPAEHEASIRLEAIGASEHKTSWCQPHAKQKKSYNAIDNCFKNGFKSITFM